MKTAHNIPLFIFALLFLTVAPTGVHSKQNRVINPITDVCWDCLFPMTISGVNVTPGHKETTKYNQPICICAGVPPKVGIPITFWEPLYLVEVTRHAYKLAAFGGISVGKESVKNRGSVGIGADSVSQNSFYHVHWYTFPVMSVLGLFEDFACVEHTSSEPAVSLSELDRSWSNDRLALILNPEAALFSNPLAQTACIADCLAASKGTPLDKLFWCAGCQGSLYPFTGTVSHHVGSLQASSLLVYRIIAKRHRLHLLKGYGKNDFCEAKYMPIIKKSLYKTQLVYPTPQTKGPCNLLGKSDLLWGLGKKVPTDDETFVYLVWVKKHCCLDAVKIATTVAGGSR